MPYIQPLSKALALETYADQKTVKFRLLGSRPTERAAPSEVLIPVAIVYRLYYLGRAFDGQVIKLIEPHGATQIDYVRLQTFISELELVAKAVSDPVSLHYLNLLLPLLIKSRGNTECCLNVVAP